MNARRPSSVPACSVPVCSLLAVVQVLAVAAPPRQDSGSASQISHALGQIAIDPEQTYRVRNLRLSRGEIKLYLTEGTLALATPIRGRRIAAVFTTGYAEGGDAEVLVLPPQRGERASLAAFARTPNLDEHFTSAVFFFSDDTAKDLLAQIAARPLHSTTGEIAEFAGAANNILRGNSSDIDVRIAAALLDNHPPDHGFFYGMIAGRALGTFDVVHEPDSFEPVSVGRITPASNGMAHFEIWTSFRPRRAPEYVSKGSGIGDYRLDSVIHPDLSMSSVARFRYTANADDGRVAAFELAARLRITSASIDGNPAEIFQHESARNTDLKGAARFLLIADTPLAPDRQHEIEVRYEGSVIRKTANGAYFVDERNTWYPFLSPMLTTFDLRFQCPENLRLVSTGDLLDEHLANGIRTVHRQTRVRQALAGFNLGEYNVSCKDHGGYHIEFFSEKSRPTESMAGIPAQTSDILDYFSRRWKVLPVHSLAVSPIAGYFGQGFPGLIYLSSVAYLLEKDRPESLRSPRSNAFFSDMLLPHEIAHQWWGNIVNQADYRTAWLIEAMANYSALEFIENRKGAQTRDAILASFRDDLTVDYNGRPLESAGPVDFGERLLSNSGVSVWDVILYEKGAWILHMLRRRLGDEAFLKLQQRMLEEYGTKPINNDDFRKLAAELTPPGQRDRSLIDFFDTWVHGTGIPKLKLRKHAATFSLTLSGVEEGFTVDVPLRCKLLSGSSSIHWVRANFGENSFEFDDGVRSCELPPSSDFLFLPDR